MIYWIRFNYEFSFRKLQMWLVNYYETEFGVVNFLIDFSFNSIFQLDILEAVKRTLVDDRPKTFDECVKYGRYAFAKNYTNRIKQLLFNFPADQVKVHFKS